MNDFVQRTPWPRRFWAPARIRYATSLSPDKIVARLADQSRGYAASRDGSLSKIGYRIEVTPRGFKLIKVAGKFLGNPPRTIAVLDATTSETGAGTLISGEVRMPYGYLTMFCIVWLATIGTAVLPAKGMFVAALILWGGFGSLFTLAQRADVGRSVSKFVGTLQTALGAPLATLLPDVGIPTAPKSPPQLVSPALFRSRMQAGIFLGGIAAFWGGFMFIALMRTLVGNAGPAGPTGPTGPVELAAFVVMVTGGLVAMTAQRGLLVRATESTAPTFGMMMRMVMPGTLSDAARKLGLNGPVVAGALYLVLVVGIVTFFSELAVR